MIPRLIPVRKEITIFIPFRPYNRICSRQCDIVTDRIIFVLNRSFSPVIEKGKIN